MLKKIAIGVGVFIVLIVIIAFAFGDPEEESTSTTPTKIQKESTDTTQQEVVDYKIVKEDDVSYADITRKDLRIVLAPGVTEAQLKAVLTKVVEDYTSQNKDVDALVIFAYDREKDTGGGYTLGKATWAPNGEWSKAENTNNRSNYKTVFEIREKITNPEGKQRPTDEEFAIYDAWQAVVEGTELNKADEDKAKAVVAKKFKKTAEEVQDIIFKVIFWLSF